jgi:peptidoglycan/LPS O-acetylase OafA/YrhL
MDSARAFFMILGIFYHTALIYTTAHAWRVAGNESNIFFDYFTYITHLFRMHGFYIIAGFFAALLIEKKGVKHFFKERLVKLGIPIIIIGATLNYVLNELSTSLPVERTGLEYFFNGDWVAHLWFLINLILYIMITVLLISKKKDTVNHVLSVFAKFSKKYFIIKFIIFYYLFYTVGHFASIYLVEKIIFVDTIAIFKYFPFYLLGYLFYYNLQTLESIVNYQKLKYHIAFTILLLLFVSKTFIFNLDVGLVKISAKITEAYMTIVLSLSFILLFKSIQVFNSSSATVRKLSDASYSIYLLHPPFILVLFYIFNKQVQNPILGFMLISLFTLLITYLLHIYFIQRYQIISLLFNGTYLKSYSKVH